MKFRIVVWNLNGLSLTSDPLRLQRARDAFRILADDNTAAFALVELGSEPFSILEELANHLGDEWTHSFGEVRSRNSEIGLLMRATQLSAATVALNTKPHFPKGKDINMGREPAALFLVKQNNKPAFLLAVVHFKAEGGGPEDYTRKCLAVWLKRELEGFYGGMSLPVLIVGDFNGEPWEEMFGQEGFRAYRRADEMFRSRDSLKLYNPMWRLMPDPLPVMARHANNPALASVPYGTFLSEIWHSLIDGVLVSSEWLADKKYVLHDDSLEILTDDLWHHIGRRGAHNARPEGVAKDLAITDHLPIAFNLEIDL